MTSLHGLPEPRIEVEGLRLDAEALRGLESVRVHQALSLPAGCELVFAAPGQPGALPHLTPGAALRVSLGAWREPLFEGEVTAVDSVHAASGTCQLRVRGQEVLHRLRDRQPVRAHVQVTVEDLARELVADLGLRVEASEAGPRGQHLIQHGQSDLEWLVEQSERWGLWWVLDGRVLRLLSLAGHGEALPLRWGESLVEASVETRGPSACRAVASAGWNASRGEVYTARAGDAGSGPGRTLVEGRTESAAHAEARARAEWAYQRARERVLTGVARGDPRLRPGTRVELQGVLPGTEGRYVLTTVTHTMDARHGFLSEVSSAPPPRRARTRASPVVPGVVSRVDDPEGLGRVRVSLSTCGEVETDWMQVLCLGAGAGKGLVVLPDVGDHVLLLLAEEDPACGVVMGGLYGPHAPPDAGVTGTAVRRFTLLTPEGLTLRFNDETRTLRLEDTRGSYLQLSPGVVRLHAETALEIEAPGQPLRIEAARIDFRRRD